MKIGHSSTGEGLEQFHDFTLQVLNKKILGHDARFQIIRKVIVLDSRPVNSEQIIYEEPFHLNSDSASFRVQLKDLNSYDYSGQLIRITLIAKCIVNDGFIFDSKHSIDFQIQYEPNQHATKDAELLIQPKDDYNMLHNYRVLPTANKIYIILALILSIPLVFISLLSGLMSQFSSVHILSFINSDSAIWAIIVGVIFAIGIWFFIGYQLKKYMTFKFKKLSGLVQQNSRIAVRDLIKGKSTIALNNITLRVVACNMEHGQYTRRDGTRTRTVSFHNPFRGVILYEKLISNIPPKIQIDLFFNGDCDFSKVYASLYPPQMNGRSHGIDIYWEVQLIHPEFVDQELIGKNDLFEFRAFYTANNNFNE